MTACLGPSFGEQIGLEHDRIQIRRAELQPARVEIGVERAQDRAGGRPMQRPAKDREAHSALRNSNSFNGVTARGWPKRATKARAPGVCASRP